MSEMLTFSNFDALSDQLERDGVIASDCEDWIVTPKDNKVFIFATCPKEEGFENKNAAATVANFKLIIDYLPAGHKLGMVALAARVGSEPIGYRELFKFLNKRCRTKNFSFVIAWYPNNDTEQMIVAVEYRRKNTEGLVTKH